MDYDKVFEIHDFINKEKIYLYVQVRDYAMEHKPEWLEVLNDRTIRKHLIAYTNSKRRIDKVKKNCFKEYIETKHLNLNSLNKSVSLE